MRAKQHVRHFHAELVVVPLVVKRFGKAGHQLFREELDPLIEAAIYPERLALARTCSRLRDRFCAVVSKFPDAAVEVIAFVRALLRRKDIVAALYLRSHTTAHLQDGEIARRLGPGMTADVVKAARQRAAKADHDWDYLLDPAVQNFFKTGRETRKLKRLIAARRKGIKTANKSL